MSKLRQANIAFQAKQYNLAAKLYQEIVTVSGASEASANFNLRLLKRRMSQCEPPPHGPSSQDTQAATTPTQMPEPILANPCATPKQKEGAPSLPRPPPIKTPKQESSATSPYQITENELLNRVREYNAKKATRKETSRVAIYTAIINNYDLLIPPETLYESWDYIVFSDQPIPGESVFELRTLNFPFDDPVRCARYIKTHPHILLRDYKYVVWIDANILIRGDHLKHSVDQFIDQNDLILGNPHPDRRCIEPEVEKCIIRKKDTVEVMREQVSTYFLEGFPKEFGLWETNLLIRANQNPAVARFNEDWWGEISKHSKRDQLSATYVMWKNKLPLRYLAGVNNFRKCDNNYLLLPHGGQSSKQFPAFCPPKFSVAHNTPGIRLSQIKDRILLENTRDYWVGRVRPKPRIVVYTAITDNYDVLKVPLALNPSLDYVCFTDRLAIAGEHPWQIRQIEYTGTDSTRTARFIKTHPHFFFPDYEISIWIDANILICDRSLETIVQRFERAGSILGVIPHPHRTCTYAEAHECSARGLDSETVISVQMDSYRSEGFPYEYGLIETNLLIRKHNSPQIIKLNNDWWKEIESKSKRDQLSLMFTLWRNRIPWELVMEKGVSFRNHSGFKRFQHGFKSTPTDKPYVIPDYLPKNYAHDCKPYWSFNAKGLPRGWLEQYQRRTVDVILCVHNALEDVRRCLQSIAPTLNINHQLIIVDDGSATETKEYLEGFCLSNEHSRVIRNETAGGYTKAANLGMKNASSDFLILLNSDTIVPRQWIKKLVHAAYSRPYIGIVGPLSNAASWQSVPFLRDPTTKRMAINELPAGMSVEEMDRLAENTGVFRHFPLVPLVNGVCYGIKREVISKIGFFDEHTFPVGYGEEDDFSVRALDSGFMLAIATHCYIFHAKSKSFGETGREHLATTGGESLRQKHGVERIKRATDVMRHNPQLLEVRARICDAIGVPPENRPRKALNSPAADDEKAVSGGPRKNPKIPGEFALAQITVEELERNRAFVQLKQGNWQGNPTSALFIIPSFKNIRAGGIRTILSVAEDWSITWKTRIVIVQYQTSNAQRSLEEWDVRKVFPGFGNLKVITVTQNSGITSLPASDIAICSSWPTAYVLAKYNECRAKFYFMQDYEALFYPAGSISGLIDETYRFGFLGICNTQGIEEVYSRFGGRGISFIPGVDHELFHPLPEPQQNKPFQVVFYGRPNNQRNAFLIGIEALKLVKAHFGDAVRIIAVGASDWKPEDFYVEGVIENHGVLESLQEVGKLYQRSDVGLVFMLTPHPSYQPLEYMASGCVTVTNANPSTTWLLRHGENAHLTSLIPETVAKDLILVLEDSKYRAALREGGIRTASKLSWTHAFDVIREFVSKPEGRA